MTRYRTERTDTDGYYAGRLDFLQAKSGPDNRRLCGVMARTLNDAVGGGGRQQPARRPGMPWLTPVLGSGCLDSAGAASLDATALADAIADQLRPLAPPPRGSESWETIGHRFTLSMAGSRLRPTGPSTGSAEDSGQQLPRVEPEVDAFTARLVLVAALLTRFCHAARAIDPTAIDRSSDEEVHLRMERAAVDDPYDLSTTVVAPLKEHLRQLLDLESVPSVETHAHGKTLLESVKALSTSVLSGLGDTECSVGLHSVRLMTEVAWYFLVAPFGTYRGWTELLLGLILREDSHRRPPFHRRRPRFKDLQAFEQHVRELFEAPTVARWAEIGQEDENVRPTVHRAVAHVLGAQASAVSRALDAKAGAVDPTRPRPLYGPDSLPMPVAFSASFDIEVEMALWARGQSFSVALPVHVAEEDASEVEMCWLLGDVDVDPDLEWRAALARLRRPTNWTVLPKADLDHTRPVVVRLIGCPLYDLGEARLTSGDVAGGETPARTALGTALQSVGVDVSLVPGYPTKLRPAVTVDAYVAQRLSEMELFWALAQSSDGLSSDRGLADRLTRSEPNNRRYWVALGVPLGDAALRHRVMSPLTARWIRDTVRRNNPSPDERRASDAVTGTMSADDALRALAAQSMPVEAHPSVPAQESDHGGPGDEAADDEAEGLHDSLAGVAINQRIDDDEAFLLSWLGLSVVKGGADEFVADLLDYERHLLSDVPGLSANRCANERGGR